MEAFVLFLANIVVTVLLAMFAAWLISDIPQVIATGLTFWDSVMLFVAGRIAFN